MADSAEDLQEKADKAQIKADEAQDKADNETDLTKKKNLQIEADRQQSIADKKQERADKETKEEEETEAEEDSSTSGKGVWSPFEPYKSYKYKAIFIPTSLISSIKNLSTDALEESMMNTTIITSANLLLGFNKISTISNETIAYSYNEGGENAYGNTFPMHAGAGDVVLSHGATRMPIMGLLRNMIAGSFGDYWTAQFSLLIFMYGKGLSHIPQIWVLKDVWPTKIEVGGFSTEKESIGDIIIESLTVSVERAELGLIRGLNEAREYLTY